MREWWWWCVWIGCIIPHYSSLEECTCRKWSNLSLLGNLFTRQHGWPGWPRDHDPPEIELCEACPAVARPGQGLCIWLGDHLPLLPSFYIINPHTSAHLHNRHSGYSPRHSCVEITNTSLPAVCLVLLCLEDDELKYLIPKYFNDAGVTQADKYSFIPG